MKTKFLIAVSIAFLLASIQGQESAPKAAPASNRGIATNWKQIAIPELPPFKPQQPKRVELPNGMIVFMTENHELPLISGSVMIRGGSDSEAEDKTGLVELYGETWRTGGTEKLSGDQLDDHLEALAAKVETGGGDSDTTINFNCLKADFQDVLGIFVELLRHPAFREDKLALSKKQMDSSISRRNDETEDIAQIQTEILGYGKQSAYARVPEYATVAAVTREDLLQWHQQHTTPNNMIFGVVGDFDSNEMEATLRKTFGEWPKGEKVEEPKITIAPEKPGIYLVDKSDVNQSEIRMVAMGIERRNPDYFALQVMNEIFGGGFSSRLFVNLRTKAGLAYSVGGGVGANWDHPGLTILEIGTKTETTTEAIKGLWDQVDLLKKEAPTEAEMKRAKDAILNSFIFNFDTPAKVLREQETYEFYGYPSDFLERYRAGVEKVTSADVLRVANQTIHKEDLKVLVVGNASEFGKQLATLGPVTPVDITIPDPHAAARPAGSSIGSGTGGGIGSGSPSGSESGVGRSNPEGKAAVAKLTEALGGAAKVDAVKTLHQWFTMKQQEVVLKIEQSTAYPDKQAQKISLPQGEVLQVVTPGEAFLVMKKELTVLSPSQRAPLIAALKRNFLNVLQHVNDPNYTFTAGGKEKLGSAEATVVDVNADGLTIRWWIGADGTLLQEQHSEAGTSGPETFTTKYSLWKDFDGLQFPVKSESFSNQERQTMMTLFEMKVNAGVDATAFEKPPM